MPSKGLTVQERKSIFHALVSAQDLGDIKAILPAGFAQGHRYSDEQQKSVEQYC